MSSPAKNKKSQEIGGWLKTYIVLLVISFIVSVIKSVYDLVEKFQLVNSNRALIEAHFVMWEIICILIISLALTVYIIFTLVRKKPNAVSLSKMYLIVGILEAIMYFITLIFIGSNFKSTISQTIDTGLVIFGTVFNIIYLSYFFYSKRIKQTFQPSSRKTPTLQKILFVCAIIFILLVISIIPLISLIKQDVSDKTGSLGAKRNLSNDEYTDGKSYFIKPKEMNINKSYIDLRPYYVLSTDEDKTRIAVVSSLTFDNESKYESLNKSFSSGLDYYSDGYYIDTEPLSEEENKTIQGFIFIDKRIVIEGEYNEIFGATAIFDSESNKVVIEYYRMNEEQIVKYDAILKNLRDSVKFD